MAGKSRRPKLNLTPEQQAQLQRIRQSAKAPIREVHRAQILLRYQAGETVAEIARNVGTTRKSVAKWINRALAMGPLAALKDTWHRPKEPVITEEARVWVVHLACTKPRDLGYAAELWTRSALAKHVRSHAVKAGHPSLGKAVKATVHRILADQPLHPERIQYYLERRDPRFEEKMRNVLLVYQAVALSNEGRKAPDGTLPVVTVSVDEKPGLQAIANTAPDLLPVAGKHPQVARDHEYKRLGTCSILAALDLHDGHVTARVEHRHRSIEFISLLQDLDPLSAGVFYPSDPGQSFLAHFPRDPSLAGDPPQPLPLRPDTHARVVAQHRRESVWQDGADLPQAHSGSVLGRVTKPHPARHCRDQCGPGGSPLEEIRRP